jgi:hypothetical protein
MEVLIPEGMSPEPLDQLEDHCSCPAHTPAVLTEDSLRFSL